jgi:hypothetical protein
LARRRGAQGLQTDPDRRRAKLLGRRALLAWYRLRIARIERDYGAPAVAAAARD